MRIKKERICIPIVFGLLLLLCSCSSAAQKSPPPEETENEIAIAASFRQEDGTDLRGSTIRFAFGGNSINYPLGDDGECVISGLPKVGDLMLTVFDRQERIQGAMTLSLSEGAVIDATTDDSGVGHIILRGDTEEVALVFVLKSDGSLLCALRLTRPGPLNFALPQEAD